MLLKTYSNKSSEKDTIYIVGNLPSMSEFLKTGVDEAGYQSVKKGIADGQHKFHFYLGNRHIFIHLVKADSELLEHEQIQTARLAGSDIMNWVREFQIQEVNLLALKQTDAMLLAYAEGLALTTYQFEKYHSNQAKAFPSVAFLKQKKELIDELNNIIHSVFIARDLINEPLSYLTASQLSKELIKISKNCGVKTEVFNKEKIEALKLTGLLAVNKGSIDPPTFNVMEWKPAKPLNKKPLILVGKGIVYDTGGLSLKPTANAMDKMKSDMSGAAVVAAVTYAVAKNKLPLHIITIIPATDNRPGENAYVPGDIIKMHSGATVEVLNTDAEGRIILADALSYAKKYKPELVVDVATLTGASARYVGQLGAVCMGTANEKTFSNLDKSGNNTYERMARAPYWKEYKKMIESDIADIKNSSGPEGASMTAGKFLEHFTDYPWIHIDIAGVSFLPAQYGYMPKNGTGFGVRLLYDFLKSYK